MADLLTTSPTSLFTVRVRDFSGDSDVEEVSMHGAFTVEGEAETFAREVEQAYPDFIEARVVTLYGASVPEVAEAQKIDWLPRQG
jgi:hypothetical protein